jgi:hypothetical protein
MCVKEKEYLYIQKEGKGVCMYDMLCERRKVCVREMERWRKTVFGIECVCLFVWESERE